jgi:hypothetical protein
MEGCIYLLEGPIRTLTIWRCGEDKYLSPLLGIETSAVQPVARRYTDWAIQFILSRVTD